MFKKNKKNTKNNLKNKSLKRKIYIYPLNYNNCDGAKLNRVNVYIHIYIFFKNIKLLLKIWKK